MKADHVGAGSEQGASYGRGPLSGLFDKAEQSYSREDCIADGGHLWPLGGRGDVPQTCKRCGYNPGWTPNPTPDTHDDDGIEEEDYRS